MKHLKKFEELNLNTYINAGHMLKNKGHQERGKKLIEWGKKGKIGDLDELNLWIKWMTSYSARVTPGTPRKTEAINAGIISDTPIKAKIDMICVNLDRLKDDIEYHKSQNFFPLSITISFDIDKSELDKIKKEYLNHFKGEAEISGSYSRIWSMELETGFKLDTNGNIEQVSPVSYSTYAELGTIFSDRKSANNFRKIIRKVLTNEIKIYTGYKDEDDGNYMTNSEAMFEIIPKLISTIEISDVETVLDGFKNINTNTLYYEDPKEAVKRIHH